MNGLFTITWSNVKSALVYGALTLAATFGLSLVQGIYNAGSIFGLDWKMIVDSAVIATLPVLIIVLSLAKNFLTDSKGNFLSTMKVIPDNDSVEKN